MDNGQPTQIPNSPEMFTEGVGTKNVEDNSFEADKNVNLENWSPDRKPGTMGGIAMNEVQSNETSPLPLPTTEKTNLPTEAYNPTPESFVSAPAINQTPADLGEVIPIDPIPSPDATADHDPTAVAEDSPTNYTWKQIMIGERLSRKSVKKFDDSIRGLDATGDIASFVNFWADAGENFRKGNPKNSSINQEAA